MWWAAIAQEEVESVSGGSLTFLEDGTWWLAAGGIVATVVVAVINIRANAKRAKEDGEHQEKMLTLQLDREKGKGLHDTFFAELDQIDKQLSSVVEDLGWMPEAAFRSSEDPVEFKKALGDLHVATKTATDSISESRYRAEWLVDRGWSRKIRNHAQLRHEDLGELRKVVFLVRVSTWSASKWLQEHNPDDERPDLTHEEKAKNFEDLVFDQADKAKKASQKLRVSISES